MTNPRGFLQTFSFSYGDGTYRREQSFYKGRIVLSEHKLYLKNTEGDIADTFIPLEKIYKVKMNFLGRMAEIFVRPSGVMQFKAEIEGNPRNLRSLVRDLTERRQMKKKTLRQEWIDPEMI